MFQQPWVAIPLPSGSHQEGNSYSLLPIKLAKLLCFRFRSLTSNAQIYLQRMRTYDYILAMWEEKNHFTEDESSDFDSPERPRQMLISKFMFKKAHNVNT